MPANRPMPTPAPQPALGQGRAYGVQNVEHKFDNPSNPPEFAEAVSESSTTRGTRGRLAWLSKHVGDRKSPLSYMQGLRRTDVEF